MKKIFISAVLSGFVATQVLAQDLQRSKDDSHGSEILCVAISQDGAWVLTGGADKRVYLRDARTGEKVKAFAFSAPVTAVAFSSSGKTFAAGTADGKLNLFDAKEQKLKKMLKEHTLDITSIAFNPVNEQIITTSKDNSVRIWDGVGSSSLQILKDHTQPVNGVAVSPDGKSFATASSDNTIKIWESGGQLKISLDAGVKGATSVAWSADGKYVACGGSGGGVAVFEMPAGNRILETNFKSAVNSVAFSADVQYLAAAGADKKIIIWNLATKAVAKEFDAHDGDVTGICFSDNGKQFISVGRDLATKFWDVSSLKIGKKKFMKDAGEPKLSTLNLQLKEDNRNGIIEYPERPAIEFTLKNSGKGQSYNLVAKVSVDQTIVGFRFEKEVLIGNLDADKYTTVSIPVYTDSTLESMGGTFTIDIADANGFTAAPLKVNFQTRGGVSYSYIMVASHAYSSATGKAEVGAPITLKLKLKNTSSGQARNVKVNFIFPPNVMAVNKLSETVPVLAAGEEKEVSVEFYAAKEFNKQKINIGLNLEGAYTNANDLVLEVKMNEPLPTTDIAIAQNTAPVELPEQPLYRGSGDPLKGLNVSKSKDMVIGKYYALIIGIDKYKGVWTPLQNAVNDAKAIEALLKAKYKFDHFQVLYNEQATRVAIITQLEWLSANAKPEDNVFIYYSGHGEYKQDLNKGYWVPVDAATNSTANYISNADLQVHLAGIKSKHTLLVADACFSGDIFRGNTVSVPFEESEKYYKEVHNLSSRQAMTSGGVEPVMDGGKDGHSVFAYYFLKTLNENQNKFMDVTQIFNKIKIPVINNSEQSPKLAPVKNTGDEGGQFIFIKKP